MCIIKNLLRKQCCPGHSNFKLIVEIAVNWFAKVEVKRFNVLKVAPEPLCSNQKIRKLSYTED